MLSNILQPIYCSKCHLPSKKPKSCAECGTVSYCVRITPLPLRTLEIHHQTCRPYSPKEVWGIRILPDTLKKSQHESFDHELLTINHPIFRTGEICKATTLYGIPLVIYCAGIHNARLVRRYEEQDSEQELTQDVDAEGSSNSSHGASGTSRNQTTTESIGALVILSEKIARQREAKGRGNLPRLNLRGISSSRALSTETGSSTQPESLDDNPKWRKKAQSLALESEPLKDNEIASLLCVDPNTGMVPKKCIGPAIIIRQDKKPLTRELVETIYHFHVKMQEESEKSENGWATMSDLMTTEAFLFFRREYYAEQDALGRPGFDPL